MTYIISNGATCKPLSAFKTPPVKITEITEMPKKDTFYLVPGVITTHKLDGGFLPGDWVPTFGEAHTDVSLDFPHLHFHYDRRFVRHLEAVRVAAAICVMGRKSRKIEFPTAATETVWMAAKCITPNEGLTDGATWPSEGRLFPQYADSQVTDCQRCPHRNAPLNGLPVVNGVVRCPAHGLRWSVEDGSLVSGVPANG
jgi:nitrite reductase/ring-hydroxylating ferredoxin subunit